MGHLAHNANLSVKAILGLAAYGDLALMRGDTQTAATYSQLARTEAQHWIQVASDGDHYRLAFDRPGTWSQKYNLVWDKILGLNVFPLSVAQEEVAYYKKVMQPYGVPLDSRVTITKTDWTVWSATLATNQADFEALVAPVYNYLDQTTSRVPLADSYQTNDVTSTGFHARPVVGGVFIKLLADPTVWNKWASRDHASVGGWAPLPHTVDVVPTSQHTPVRWHYTTAQPPAAWIAPGFNDTAWSEGPGGFGTAGTPGAVVGTTWNTSDIWLRRTFTMPAGFYPNLRFSVYHDEDVQIYVNGVLAATATGYVTSYQTLDISPTARALLQPGATITLAVHCHQTVGGQGVDVGLVDLADYSINFNTLLALAQHYAQPGAFSDGDLNGDGQVNFADLLLLAQQDPTVAARAAYAIALKRSR
jgi:hypothetical protein